MKKIMTIFLVLSVCFTMSCSGRQPSAKSAQKIGASYFQSYGKKYSSTVFGHKNVDRVMINSVEEISFRVALVDALVHHVDGHVSRVLMRMEKKFPGGWGVKSWEMVGTR